MVSSLQGYMTSISANIEVYQVEFLPVKKDVCPVTLPIEVVEQLHFHTR